MKHKLSQWHSADTKPVHVGVYQVKTKGLGNRIWLSTWNGKWWSMQVTGADTISFWVNVPANYQNKQWRGIVVEELSKEILK